MPLQKLSGVAIFVSLQECGFSRTQPYTGQPTLQGHRPKLGLRCTSSNATILSRVHAPHYANELLVLNVDSLIYLFYIFIYLFGRSFYIERN